MNKITEVIKELGFLNETELVLFNDNIKIRELKKGDYLVKADQNVKEIAFIASGMVRSFYITQKGDDITYCVSFENDFITAYSSYINGKPATENIQALVDTTVHLIQKDFIEKLAKTNHNTTKVLRFFAEQYILELEHRVFSYQKEDALTRYEYMLKNHPNYINEIPMHYLATYLGITQRHLSRIRKELRP